MSIEKDLKAFNDKINAALNDLTKKPALTPLATGLADTIRRRTRLGSGVEVLFAKKTALAKLAASTIVGRKRKKKAGTLSDKTSPTKSNLTETGQMLDALEGRAMNQLIEIGLKGDRNKKLAGYHQKGNSKLPRRPFLSLGAEDVKQLTASMQDKFSEILRRVFK